MAEPPRLEDYTILLLCPLLVEQQAACLMLDEVHEGIPERSIGQTVLYTLGRISTYNVAIAGYPAGEVGIGVSGSMISEALRDFPNIELGLLVGIAAGIPSPTRDIRLGDVAVAVPNKDNAGIIGYDLVKVEDEEVRVKQWQNSTHPLLRSAITSIRVRASFPGEGFTRHLRSPRMQRVSPRYAACDEPRVHYGTILSGNGVIKSEKRRDELRDQYDGIAIEMEAAGMMTRLPVAVIRGISDFADSAKNDDWQPYAALTAAAYAKEILIRLGPRKAVELASRPVISPNAGAWLGHTLPEQCCFTGRENELLELDEWLNFRHPKPLQRSVIALWGLSGVGKSQLVAEFVKGQRNRYPDNDIFWIAAESNEVFEQSIIGMLTAGVDQSFMHSEACEKSGDRRAVLIKSFFIELQSTKRARWLLILDGVATIASLQHIRGYLDLLSCGSIILTSRSREVAERFSRRMEIKGLPEEDALNLLNSEIDIPFRSGSEETLELARLLKGHPLSLKLAISVISQNHLRVEQYIDKWRKRQFDSDDLPTDTAFLRSFEISFEELKRTSPLSIELLTLFSFLDHKDMWHELLSGATASDFPEWVRQLATRTHFHECCIRLYNLSFAEARPQHTQSWVYEIHPAIHEFARWEAKGKEEEYVRLAVSLVAARVPRSTDKNFPALSQRLEPHADQCKIHLERGRGGRGIDLMELAQFGNLFRLVGRYGEASRLYQGILNLLTQTELSGSTLELMAIVGNNLGLVQHAQRRYRLAVQSFDQSLQRLRILKKDEDEDNQDEDDAPMSTLYNRGRSFLMLGELDSAQQDLISAAQHFSRIIDNPDHSPKADEKMLFYFRILNDLGETYLRKNDVDQAEYMFKQAFDGHKQHLHELHPTSFAVRLNMGRVCVEKFRFASARTIFEYIIRMYTEWWGRRHPETMRAVDELAMSYMRQGKLKRLMGDDGDPELKMAGDLWAETLGFYQETYGISSDITHLVTENLQSLNSRLDDPYWIYYSSSS